MLNSFIIKTDGSLWAWGYGQLGNGSSQGSYLPIQILSHGVLSVSAYAHTVIKKTIYTNYSLAYYSAGANGLITGNTLQMIDNGSNGSVVTAVPITGYHFVDWSDGSTANPRTDTNVTADITVIANFVAGEFVHSADSGSNWMISEDEVNSFIGLYNSNNNAVSYGNGSFDDANRITMREVLRVIYLYNGGGAYQGGQVTVDTYDVYGQQGALALSVQPPVPQSLEPELPENTIVVANSADSGAGSFRNAIANAADGDTITFDESIKKITLASEILIDKSIMIDGNGVAIVSGDNQTRIFQVYNEYDEITVTLSNIGIVDGNNSLDEFGGAIYNNGEDLRLDSCLLGGNANTAAHESGVFYGKGGAVYTSGTLTVMNCVFQNNTAEEENDIYSTNGDVTME